MVFNRRVAIGALLVVLLFACNFVFAQKVRKIFKKVFEDHGQPQQTEEDDSDIQVLYLDGSSGQESAGEDVEHTITVDDRVRNYIVHLPPDFTRWMPVVIVLHRDGGNNKNIMKISNMSAKADQEGFLAVYPNGSGVMDRTGLTWNAGDCCSYSVDNKIDDVKFIRMLIEELEVQYQVNTRRIYVTGMSNGAMMAYRLACELSNEIAAIAPVAGTMECLCGPINYVSVMAFHGLQDNIIPYHGGESSRKNRGVDFKPVPDTIEFWVKHNCCSPYVDEQESENVIRELYDDGIGGVEVIFYTLKNSGHAWPGGGIGLYYGEVDIPTNDVSATDLMWEFFKKHSK